MLDSAALAAQPAAAFGRAVLFGVDWLVEGKFYSVFAMLLGMGFALQASRADARGDHIGPFFRRRMAVLMLIGLTHMYALWAGDILLLYGVIVLLLPTLWRWPSATTRRRPTADRHASTGRACDPRHAAAALPLVAGHTRPRTSGVAVASSDLRPRHVARRSTGGHHLSVQVNHLLKVP